MTAPGTTQDRLYYEDEEFSITVKDGPIGTIVVTPVNNPAGGVQLRVVNGELCLFIERDGGAEWVRAIWGTPGFIIRAKETDSHAASAGGSYNAGSSNPGHSPV